MRVCWPAMLLALILVGCATPSRTAPPLNAEPTNSSEWQGRISVQVQGDTPSSMSASFLLRGNANHGELDLYSPLGTTLGALLWTPHWVQFSDGGKRQYFNSLSELTEKATGAALPIEAVFDWLQGLETPTFGWQVDLSAASQGTITAHRTNPAPNVTLRIKLDP